MLVIDDQVKRHPYTLKETVELDYPQFWGGANECIHVAKELQNLSVKLLPHYKLKLPDSLDLIKEKNHLQIIYSQFLTWLCEYGLAKKIWTIADDNCRMLAQSANESDSQKRETVEQALIDLMTFVDRITKSLDEINDDDNGFDALEELIDSYIPDLDFPVMNQWSYRDVVGTIHSQGLFYNGLWRSAISHEIPMESNIPDLMGEPDDNKMVRVY